MVWRYQVDNLTPHLAAPAAVVFVLALDTAQNRRQTLRRRYTTGKLTAAQVADGRQGRLMAISREISVI